MRNNCLYISGKKLWLKPHTQPVSQSIFKVPQMRAVSFPPENALECEMGESNMTVSVKAKK